MAEKKINDRTVRYDRLPGDQGLDVLLRLLQILGDGDTVIESLITGDPIESEKLAITGILKFAKNMDRAEVKSFILDMVTHCSVGGVVFTRESLGVMSVAELLAVAQFAIKTEFAGFFDEGAGSVLLKAMRQAA